MESFRCKDMGIHSFFETTGTTDQEIMNRFIDHAYPEHKMSVLPADIIFQVQNSIKK